MALTAGSTLLWAGSVPKRHLWCVLTPPDPTTSKVIVVMLVSVKGHTEPHVTLNVGDHPFIEHPTHVDYGGATFAPVSKLERAIANRSALAMDDLSAELLRRLKAGLLASSRVAGYLTEHCRTLFDADGNDL